jgi:hypothetical protein
MTVVVILFQKNSYNYLCQSGIYSVARSIHFCATGGLSLRVAGQKFITIPLMVVLTLMAASAANGGEYCKWTDESGVVHYDEQCPDNVTSAIVATEGERTESQIRLESPNTQELKTAETSAKCRPINLTSCARKNVKNAWHRNANSSSRIA